MKDGWRKYISLFLEYLKAEKNASRYTGRNYEIDLNAFASFSCENDIVTPVKVDKLLVRKYLNHLNEKSYARSSISLSMSAIRSFFRYLLREGIVRKNPAANITSPRLDRRLPSFLTLDEAKRLVESPALPENPVDVSAAVLLRNIAMLEMLYASGMRVSELVSMNLEQVDLPANEIRVWGKGNKERMVLIGTPASRALTEYIAHARPLLLGGKKSNALFVNRYGERILVRRVQKIITQYSLGINKKIHPHILRHTFATHMLEGGADLKVVQELLGHADLSSTQIYTHVTQKQARRIYLAAHPMAHGDNRE